MINLRCPSLSGSQPRREEMVKFHGDGWPYSDPTGFFWVRPPVIVSLKEKGLQGPGEEVTSGKQNGALFPYHGLPVSA